MSRYIVIGAGAVGATVAAQLHEAGKEVVLVARGRHLTLLRERGLEYVRPEGVRRVLLRAVGGPDDVVLRDDDVLVLATKSQDSEAAIAQWAWQPVGTTTSAAEVLPIVLLQNGLENVRTALRRFGTVLDAVVLIPSSYVTAGQVISPGSPKVGVIVIGYPTSGDTVVADGVADDLRAAFFGAQTTWEIERLKAGKLLGNLAHNLDAVYRPSRLRDIAAAELRAEAEQVFAGAGVEAGDLWTDDSIDLSGFVVQSIEGYERGGSSTWQSLARSVPHESDFLNGEIVLLARLHGHEAPLNAAVQQRVARAAREGTAAGTLGDVDLAVLLSHRAGRRLEVLLDIKQLRDELASENPPVLLDVRWALGDPHGRAHYEEAHIPGAVFVDLDTELAEPPTPLAGRHPLPSIERLQAAAQRWGISTNRSVVVYDNNGGLSSARAWWLLRWAGLANVRILDGALGAWVDAGFELETGTTVPNPGDVELSGGHLPTLTADEAAELATDGVLLDARAPERYRGELEPIDPRAGHIPGAISAPTAENLEGGTFLPAEKLRARFTALGIEPGARVGVYCGSGVTAAHQVAALAVAGIEVALFPGSWSAWSSDPGRVVAVGATPFGGSSAGGETT
jgi:thiosulfate/3-mercaptopyruvate sulfurtransferase